MIQRETFGMLTPTLDVQDLALSPAMSIAPLKTGKRSWRASLFDRLIPQHGLDLTDEDKDRMARQGLLQAGLAMLGTRGQGFGGTVAQGLQGGLLAANQGVEDERTSRYRDAMMARTMEGAERNSQIERLATQAVRPDGTIDQTLFGQLAAMDPERAKTLRSALEGPSVKWQLGRVGDGQGGSVDVLFNPENPDQMRTLDGQPVGGASEPLLAAPTTGGGGGLLSGAFGAEAPAFGILRDAVEQAESGGNPNAVSPKGALGRMQTMPGTLTDPGFGIAPARDRSDAEMTRVGNEYLGAMLNRYADPRLALAAYNWGPGNVDAALKRHGTPEAVIANAPKETQDYVRKITASVGGAPRMTSPALSGIGRWPAKAPESNETFSQPQEVIDPATGKRQLVQFGNRGGRRVVNDFAPAAPQPKGGGQLPVAALKVDLEIEDAIAAAQGIFSTAQRHLQRFADGKLDVSRTARTAAWARKNANMATPADTAIIEFDADIKRIVNESLRLNKGVQTEGDAQREVDAVMSATDNRTMIAALDRLVRLNQRALDLQQRKRALLRQNYGSSPAAAPAATQPAAAGKPAGRLKFNPKTGRLE